MGEADAGLDENDRNDHRDKKRRVTGELSRSASPSIHTPSYPVSVRQQMALLRQMSQQSPSGSTDGETMITMTPIAHRKRVPRVHKKNTRGETPLHVAARRGDGAKCFELIREGADVNCADYAGWTALHEACNHNHFETAEILLKNGADVNRASADGETPLHDAAASRNAKLVWLLLMYGADREIRNNQNKRAADIVHQPSTAYDLLTTNELPSNCPSEMSTPSPVPSNEAERRGRDQVPVNVPLSVTIESESLPLFASSSAPATQVIAAEPEAFSRAVSMAFAQISQSPEPMPVESEMGQEKEAAMDVVDYDQNSNDYDNEIQPEDSVSAFDNHIETSHTGIVTVDVADMKVENESETEMLENELELQETVQQLNIANDNTGSNPIEKEEEEEEDEDMEQNEPQTFEMDVIEEDGSNPGWLEEDKSEFLKQEERQGIGDSNSNMNISDDVHMETQCTSSSQSPMGTYASETKYTQSNNASPSNAFEFTDDLDDMDRSELGRKRALRPGRSCRGRPNSGSNTPTSLIEKKVTRSAGRGRGGRRGRGGSKTSEIIEESSNPLDVYDFRGSPDSDDNVEYNEDKERIGSSSKRFRLNEVEIDLAGSTSELGLYGNSINQDDMDGDDDDDKPSCSHSTKKVPPLRISLTKTPSEEDPAEDTSLGISLRSKNSGSKGRFSKRLNDTEDAQRVTRSKVKQAGRCLDGYDLWPKKKRGRTDNNYWRDESRDPSDKSYSNFDDVAVDDQEEPTSVHNEKSEIEELYPMDPNKEIVALKELMCERWAADCNIDVSRKNTFNPEKFKNFSLYKANYKLASDTDDSNSELNAKPRQCPDSLSHVWLTQEKERKDLLTAIDVERIRLKLFCEQEFIRMERRMTKSVPYMSAIRVMRESEVCNPLILNVITNEPPEYDQNRFIDGMARKLSNMNFRHKMEVSSLHEYQKNFFTAEVKTSKVDLTTDMLNECVPIAPLDEFKISLS